MQRKREKEKKRIECYCVCLNIRSDLNCKESAPLKKNKQYQISFILEFYIKM